MKLKGFRELLQLKAKDNDNLCTLIKYADSEVLAEKIIESLEKMARARHKGDAANHAIRDFGLEMDHELEPAMIRDALGHHVSRYKAHLHAGDTARANKHAKQAFRIMNLADKTQKHSHGKLSIDYVDPKPWERAHPSKSKTFQDKYDETGEIPKPVASGKKKLHQFVNDTKGVNYSGSDYSFLAGKPHDSHSKETDKHGHKDAYPFEHIKVNGKYIHVDDLSHDDLHKPGSDKHRFDYHPIMDHFEVSGSKRTPEHDEQYHGAKEEFYNSSHIDDHFDHHDELAKLPDYDKRGLEPSKAVHLPTVDPKVNKDG